MDNEEFIELKNKALKALLITIIICIPLIFFFIIKYNTLNSSVYKSIKKKDTFIIYIYQEKDNSYNDIIKKLKAKKTKYYEYDINKHNDLELILRKIELTVDDVSDWCLIYIKNGKMVSNTNNYDDLDGFLNNI